MRYQEDWEVVLAAVKQNGLALAEAAPGFRAEKPIALAAVRQSAGAGPGDRRLRGRVLD